MNTRPLPGSQRPYLVVAAAALLIGACSGSDSGSDPGDQDVTAGGTTNSGGATQVGGGGSSAAGTGSSGASSVGGRSSLGGAISNGGALVQTGGSANTGGSSVTGGQGNSGGSVSSGGTSTSGGRSTSGGADSQGGSSSGGTSSGGASSGGATSGGAASGGSSSSCNVNPVTPDATPEAKNLLCYLYDIYKTKVLSGQQETNWYADPPDIGWYLDNIGEYPAVLGSDFLYRDGVSCSSVTRSTNRAIDYWNAGGIIMFRYHMGLPAAGTTCMDDCYQGSNCSEPTNTTPDATFFSNLISSGTAENTALIGKLDYVAVQIAAMKAANVPVILAMYHEAQPNGWFWWAMTQSGSSFTNLWKYTFDYLTKTKGLNNIIWLMPFSGNVDSAFYPGDGYVDIGGPDQYTQPSNLMTFNASDNWNPSVAVLGNSMPITMHETGSALQPDSMFPSYPWVLFSVWATFETDPTYNTVDSIKAAYASQYTLVRDDIPNLK